MSFLLDTHVVLWWLNGDELSEQAAESIAHPDHLLFISAASMWEISIKSALGKLSIGADAVIEATEGDFERLPISWRHASAVAELPHHHRDPFDRMLVAQAKFEDLTLITRDQMFDSYDVNVIAG